VLFQGQKRIRGTECRFYFQITAEISTGVEKYQKITKSIKNSGNQLEMNGKTVKILQRNRKNRFFTGIYCGILLNFAVIVLDGISLCMVICIRVSAPVCRCTTIIIPDAIRY
jgi:hypothetical protein